eukprot:TRINITY_DN5006_c0_g1_i3.p1 TRINITY_DN5006_c0_g1~~TRINITY_DN5006_c0_g1_i3.p1  ORF type:complete len:135 (+),score=64.73 TRINITY_DN5006_c0_g1_i3:131-535(+)
MADKYRRVEKVKATDEPIKENEIRVTTQGRIRIYINYATTIFKEKGGNTVVLKAMGRAINKTVTIAEIMKRTIPDLHQITHIDSTLDTKQPGYQAPISKEQMTQITPSQIGGRGRGRGGRGRGRGGQNQAAPQQ